jgi:hypothetical protein
MNQEPMLKPALIGGVILGILSALPIVGLFNCFCCAWIIGGGVLAAYLYVKDSSVPVTMGRGVALGLLTGIIGTIVYALFSIPLFLFGPGTNFMEHMRQSLERMPNVPPETLQMLQSFYARGGMGAFIYAMIIIFMLIVSSLFGMLGGVIGVALFEKRKRGALSIEPPPYQPPSGMPPPPPPDVPPAE